MRHVQGYLDLLESSGRYQFTSDEARSWLATSADATRLALHRQKKKGRIATPARGFHVIVPAEYRSIGCLPADQFIPALMQNLGLPYYAGLLSAAQYYGAAHQRPQSFQVFVPKNRRQVACGAVRVTFIARKAPEEVATRRFNTPRGTIEVSTPESTAFDLVGYSDHAGGLDQVVTVLAELAESIDADLLVDAARRAPLPWAQRLGVLLEVSGAGELTDPLLRHVRSHARKYVPLVPQGAHYGKRETAWKIIVNDQVELES